MPANAPSVASKFDAFFEQRILLTLFGLFVVVPAGCFGTLLSYSFFANNALLAYIGGGSAALLAGGFLGFIMILARQTAQQITITVSEK